MNFKTLNGPELHVMFQVDNNAVILKYDAYDSTIEIPLSIKEG